MEDWGKIVIAIIGVLGSASIWRFFEKKVVTGAWKKKFDMENSDAVQFRRELQNRVKTLEESLLTTNEEHKQLQQKYLELSIKYQEISIKLEFITEQNLELREKLLYVEKENEILKNNK